MTARCYQTAQLRPGASAHVATVLDTVGAQDYCGIRRRNVEESAGVRRRTALIEYSPARSTRHRIRRLIRLTNCRAARTVTPNRPGISSIFNRQITSLSSSAQRRPTFSACIFHPADDKESRCRLRVRLREGHSAIEGTSRTLAFYRGRSRNRRVRTAITPRHTRPRFCPGIHRVPRLARQTTT